jgi:hypothetical protein
MSWTQTRTRWRTLREVSAEIERRRDGELPWSADLAAVFGTRRELVLALRYLWMLTLTARVDDATALDGVGAARLAGRRLAEQHADLRLVLDRHCPELAAHEKRIVSDFGGYAPAPVWA